jgi:hypothetical protein
MYGLDSRGSAEVEAELNGSHFDNLIGLYEQE